jgi:hypothetical protein
MRRNRAWRRTQDERVIHNRMKFLKETDKERVKYFEDKQNKLAVKHPCDCGRTDCGVCHGHKRPGCSTKWKDEHGLLEEVVRKEVQDDLSDL